MIDGSVKPGFESVRELFGRGFANGTENSAQLCVYVNGERVVDLWGDNEQPTAYKEVYDADSLQLIFSSTKMLESLCFALLADKGLIKYDDLVTKHWPEFESSASTTKIEDVFRHECGLVHLNESISWNQTQREEIKKNRLGSVIEKSQRCYPPEEHGSKRYVHSNPVITNHLGQAKNSL